MFVSLSQYASWFFSPLTWLLFVQLATVLLLYRRRFTAASVCVGIATLLLVGLTCAPLAGLAIRPLEQAIATPAALPPKIDGIITLAGAQDSRLTRAYGKPQLNGEAERLTEFIALAREHPEAKLVFSGSSRLLVPGISEGEVVRRFFAGQGFDATKVIFAEESTTTAESAVYARRLLQPRYGEVWILITSANHMPRAYGAFRKAGWDIIPYPVSYRVLPESGSGHRDRDYDTLVTAIHEWVGLAAYRLSGRM